MKILGNTLLLKELTTGENKNSPEPDKEEKEQEPPSKPKTAKTPEYLLSVPVLNTIYEQFNDELWEGIALVDFLNMFTTAVNRQDNFMLKHRQTTRFYYLLKKIWINGDQTLFNSEKGWIVPFLGHYGLSFSAGNTNENDPLWPIQIDPLNLLPKKVKVVSKNIPVFT